MEGLKKQRIADFLRISAGDGDGFGFGFGSGDGRSYGDGDGRGYDSGDGFGYGSGDGFGHGYGYGYGSGDGYGYGYGSGDGSGSRSGDGYGYGDGRGYGEGTGYGSGSGYGYGYGSSYGYGSGDGSGDGYGYGDGYGFGSGDGSGDGYGYGEGSGFGFGFGSGYDDTIQSFCGKHVYMVDRLPTIIDRVTGSIAKGRILHSDLTTTPCFVVKGDGLLAHGDTLRAAMDSLREKQFENMPEDERIEAFISTHARGKRYPCADLYDWHHRLTGSCEMGRREFAKDHGIDIEHDSMTVDEFIDLTRDAYGGDVIRALKRALDQRRESQ